MSTHTILKKGVRNLFPVALASLLASLLAYPMTACHQQADKPAAKAAAEKAADKGPLPLNKVVMFNSGVGYFEHRGQVEGDTQIDLRFRVEDINDLLKSMILEDRGGGKISTVTYGSRDPITKTLKTFPVDLTGNPTLGAILDQMRGERMEVEATTPITGVLLGVEKRKKEVGKDHEVVETEFLNLLTDTGLRSVALDSVGRIKVLDEKLDGELRQALAVLAGGHDTDKKTVSLNLLGTGKHRCASATSSRRRSGRPAIAWCSATRKPPFCKAGRSSKTRPKPTGTTSR